MGSRLGLSIPEALALPWWQWDAYVEGLEWDLTRQAELAGAEGEESGEEVGLDDLGIDVRYVG